MGGKLEPIYVPADDIDIYEVEEEGWYLIDEDFRIVQGPLDSYAECLKAIGAPKAA